MKTFQRDQLEVRIYPSAADLGQAAASDLAAICRSAIAERGTAAVILATGNSQLTFMAALSASSEIEWDKITILHMDQYIGLPVDHSASFERYLRRNLIAQVRPAAFFEMRGNGPDPEAEIARYTGLLEQYQPVACVMGIGENGHLAFNDPPADFSTPAAVHMVTLAETARQQQVGEGHFPTINDVPTHALTLTVPALLKPPHVLAVVPEARKARIVKKTLEEPVSPDCPATILRTCAHAKLYLDQDSAALLSVPS